MKDPFKIREQSDPFRSKKKSTVERKVYIGAFLIVFMLIVTSSVYSLTRVYKPDEETYKTLICGSDDGLYPPTDDNIQLAFDTLGSSPGTVELPSGRIYVDKTIWINYSYQNLIGQEGKATELYIIGDIQEVIRINDAGDCNIENLLINGDSSARDADGIYLYKASGATLDNIYFAHLNGSAVIINGTYGIELINLKFNNIGNDVGNEAVVVIESNSTRHTTYTKFVDCIWDDNCKYRCLETDGDVDSLTATNCRFVSYIGTPDTLVYLGGTNEASFVNCDFRTNKTGVTLLNITGSGADSIKVSNTDFTGGLHHIFLNSSECALLLSNNNFMGSDNWSIIINNGIATIDGNEMGYPSNPNRHNIWLRDQAYMCSVIDNHFLGNSDDGSDGVLCDNWKSVISGNRFRRLRRSVYVDARDCIISDNIFFDHDSGYDTVYVADDNNTIIGNNFDAIDTGDELHLVNADSVIVALNNFEDGNVTIGGTSVKQIIEHNMNYP